MDIGAVRVDAATVRTVLAGVGGNAVAVASDGMTVALKIKPNLKIGGLTIRK
jgi:hypothetical protein